MTYKFLFDIALILLSTKLLGLLTKRLEMPQVVGALLAGLILGPAMFNILHETEFIVQMAEIGVIVLMFSAGLETDLKELKQTGKAALVISVLGVVVALGMGFGIAYLFNDGSGMDTSLVLQNTFIGVVIASTSVSITVESLKELGKLNSRAGNAILGAALLDDIIGIIAMTLIISLADTSVSIWIVLAKMIGFFIFAAIVGIIVHRLFTKWVKQSEEGLRRFVIVAFSICLLMAFISEHFFGVADITGAFIAGLIISNTDQTNYITKRVDILSYMLLSPIFFASIGIKVVLPQMTVGLIAFSILLVVVSMGSKVLGCALGSKLCKYTSKESLQIGIGMMTRGEVTLIVATKGAAVGLMSSVYFGPIVIMVLVTTIITPILLKLAFKEKAIGV